MIYKDEAIAEWAKMNAREWGKLAPKGAEAVVMLTTGYRWLKFEDGGTQVNYGGRESGWYRWEMSRERIDQEFDGLIAYRPTANEKPEPIPTPCLDEKATQKGVEKPYGRYSIGVSGVDSIDVYDIHAKYGIDDPSGCIQHASKKLLLAGVRTGEKPKWKDVKEARDTLNRWLQINGVAG